MLSCPLLAVRVWYMVWRRKQTGASLRQIVMPVCELLNETKGTLEAVGIMYREWKNHGDTAHYSVVLASIEAATDDFFMGYLRCAREDGLLGIVVYDEGQVIPKDGYRENLQNLRRISPSASSGGLVGNGITIHSRGYYSHCRGFYE